jgi:hypothetical protein
VSGLRGSITTGALPIATRMGRLTSTRRRAYTGLAMLLRAVSLPILAATSLLVGSLAAQTPAGASAPAWNKRSRLTDGRTFVTDGAIALDAAIARPASLDTLTEMPPAAIERLLKSPFTTEIRFSVLSARERGYVTPDGVLLKRTYVEFLRRNAGASRLMFRAKGPTDPVVIVVDGQTVGVLMPMAR